MVGEYLGIDYQVLPELNGWVGRFFDPYSEVPRQTMPKRTSSHALAAVRFGIRMAVRPEASHLTGRVIDGYSDSYAWMYKNLQHSCRIFEQSQRRRYIEAALTNYLDTIQRAIANIESGKHCGYDLELVTQRCINRVLDAATTPALTRNPRSLIVSRR